MGGEGLAAAAGPLSATASPSRRKVAASAAVGALARARARASVGVEGLAVEQEQERQLSVQGLAQPGGGAGHSTVAQRALVVGEASVVEGERERSVPVLARPPEVGVEASVVAVAE